MNRTRQFLAILHKNFILQTRGRRSLLGIGGWAALIIQLLLPVAFFFVMYLPKYYIKPTRHGESMGPAPMLLESRSWADPYDGPATYREHGGRARLLLAPDSPHVRGLARLLARSLACPRDPALRTCPVPNMPMNFHCLFMPPLAPKPSAAAAAAAAAGAEASSLRAAWGNWTETMAAAAAVTAWENTVEISVEERDTGQEAAAREWSSGGTGGAGGVGLGRFLQRRSRRRILEADGGGGGDGGQTAAAAAAEEEAVESTQSAAVGADPCSDFSTCLASPACWEHVVRDQMAFATSLEAARRHVSAEDPDDIDALIAFPDLEAAAAAEAAPEAADGEAPVPSAAPGVAAAHAPAAPAAGGANDSTSASPANPTPLLSHAVLGMNHSDVPPSRLLLDLFEVVPTRGNGLALYRRYWFLSNLQLALQRSVIGLHVAANTPDAPPPSPQPAGPPAAPPPSHPAPAPAQPNEDAEQRAAAAAGGIRGRRRRKLPEGDGSVTCGGAYGGGGDAQYDSVYDRAVPAHIAVSYKPFPWPAVTEDLGAASAAIFFNLLLVYAFLAPTRAVVGDIVREKELRLREGMRVLGLSERAYWASWGLTHWLLLALSGALCAAAGTYPFASSSWGLMLAFFWLYGAALVSYSYALSCLFSSSRVAGTASQLAYALSMLPGFVLPAVYQYGSWTWYAACLLPPSAASMFAAALVNWEKVAEGITPRTLWVPISSANAFSAGSVLCVLAADVVLYALLTWYLDKVLPKSYGQRLPWWFVFDRRYWGAAGGRGGARAGGGSWWRRGAKAVAVSEDGEDNATPLLPGGDPEAAGAGEEDAGAPPAVETRGLVRVFRTTGGGSKRAVDGLDLRIERGRITALLGHNGAGKTTTIHILTGMLQPTAGSATVNGFDVATQMDQVRSSLGICPQFDILWPNLSVYEHLRLYGAVKGYGGGELHEVATAAAASVGLTPKLSCPAGELSGGQRRKLSVAIAFLGQPAVVFLDEPTSGMDPYSRRFTWEVIRRHRSNSAIVLTTHSMEEADLLGDRVLILARGRLAAEGSGLELKAAHGVGYNLTLVLDPAVVTPNAGAPTAVAAANASPAHSPPPSAPTSPQQQPPQQQPSPSPNSSPNANARDIGSAELTTLPPRLSADGAAAAAPASPTTATPTTATPTAPSAAAAAILAFVRSHVPSAALLSSAGAEAVLRLPREAGPAFPALLRQLDGPVGRRQLGVASWGLSLTTLEEVFLSITAAAEEKAAAAEAEAVAGASTTATTTAPSPTSSPTTTTAAAATPSAAPPAAPPLTGLPLARQQLRALLAKRLLCAARDRLAVLTQLAVPLALVALALWVSALQVREPGQPALDLTRGSALLGRPLAVSAAPAARNASEGCLAAAAAGGGCLGALLAGHPAAAGRGGPGVIDSGATALYTGDPRVRPSTLEAYLLSRWYGGGGPVYDAIHVTALPPPAALVAGAAGGPAAAAASPALSFVLSTNQSAVHALPAALSDAMSAALSYVAGGLPAAAAPPPPPRAFSFASWPLPTLASEPVVRIQRDAAGLMLVLCLVLASSVLSASYVVFLVREQDSGSKHLQLVAGAPAPAYWAANYLADLASFALSAAGILALIAAYRLPQFRGARLGAAAGLLAGFGPAGLSLTYLAHYLFRDEMRALQRLNTAYFLSGYLGFLATWVADLISLLVPRPAGLRAWNDAAKAALRTASPHYCFAKGMYDVQATYDMGFPFFPRHKPFDWDVFGSPMAHMAAQTIVYGALAVLYDTGFATAVHARCQDAAAAAARWLRCAWRRLGMRMRGGRRRRGGRGGGGGAAAAAAVAAPTEDGASHVLELGAPLTCPPGQGGRALAPGTPGANGHAPAAEAAAGDGSEGEGGSEAGEDEDVAAERRAVQEGRREGCQVLMRGLRKSYWPAGPLGPPLVAVRGMWLGVPAGECFGLLGVNGAGKTTTFRMLTGEVLPDAGDAEVGGHSVRTQLAAARRQLGYCPQFEALPGAMTGREVAAMYARLRGVPEPGVAPLVDRLLGRLGLAGAADTACGGYSGGMRRKLGVAVALVGEPRVTALDEPSTGMDPGARRGLWGCLQGEVMRAGRSVLLTSHSMEECEALSGRLTVMARGSMRCIGSPQHLKGRFGGGYLLELKTLPRISSTASLAPAPASASGAPSSSGPWAAAAARSGGAGGAAAASASAPPGPGSSTAAEGEAGRLAAWVAAVTPGSVLTRADQHRYTFSLPRGADLPSLLAAVEGSRGELALQDYALSQATLEHVFVALAGEAAREDAAEGGAR